MAEEFALSSLVVPGTYIRVRAEGLITAGGISTGNIGIVGSAATPEDDEAAERRFGKTHLLGDYGSAVEAVGRYDAYLDSEGNEGKANLPRALEILFANGARTVFARALKEDQINKASFEAAFAELFKEDVNILLAPELPTAGAGGSVALLNGLVDAQEGQGKDLIAVAGTDKDDAADVKGQVKVNKRLIFAAPGIQFTETLYEDDGQGGERVASSETVDLPGTYGAVAVAGLLSGLVAQSSPTNKTLAGIATLTQRFTYNEIKDLISAGVLVLEERLGVRVVRGVSTEMATSGPFQQITTRRIVDFAKAGIRKVGAPFIGRLNNQRVRKALHGAIDGFLASMVQDEALTQYQLEVFATRDDEIAGRAQVRALLRPTFSIDFIAVTLVLE